MMCTQAALLICAGLENLLMLELCVQGLCKLEKFYMEGAAAAVMCRERFITRLACRVSWLG